MFHADVHLVSPKGRARIWLLKVAAAAFTMLGTAFAAGDAEAEIRDLTMRYAESYSERDATAVAEMFTEDALFVAPDGTRLDGREEIEAMFRIHFDSGSLPLSMTVLETVVLGDTAYALTTYAALDDDGDPLVEGYGLAIWVRVDGTWMWHRKVANVVVPEVDEAGSGCAPSTRHRADVVTVAACS